MNTDLYYKMFGLSQTCTDDELRRAYLSALLKHHPDKNPGNIEAATVKTQQFNSAYAELKRHREKQTTEIQSMGVEHGKITIDGFEYTIEIQGPFFGGVDIGDIAERKETFRNEWQEYRRNSSDPVNALRLVHAAFRAERQNSVKNLLLNPILIDSASLLLSLVDNYDACEIIIKWANILRQNQRGKEAVQILEDTFATGKSLPSVANELRSLHYSWAQYSDPITGCKATPIVRIEHLRRILELGFEYDYIYKLMAEVYHDLGQNDQARAYLNHAYRLNPNLSGAMRISRALGLIQNSQSSLIKPKSSVKYKYSRPGHIPSPSQIRSWVQHGNWDSIIEFANPHDYSPRILSKTREILRLIAISLEDCQDQKAIGALITLLKFNYYWEVNEAALISLSKIGDENTLRMLEKFKSDNWRLTSTLKATIPYLRTRVSNKLCPAKKSSPQELFSQAEKEFSNGNYGQARILLEFLHVNSDHLKNLFHDVSVLLARSCAKMNDTRTSVAVIKPILPKLSDKSQYDIYEELASWLWDDLILSEYDSINDENYILSLEIHHKLAMKASIPDDVLKNLRRITRLLELLGESNIVQWLRQLIRDEAPGTSYVDEHNRENYIRNVELSPLMKNFLSNFDIEVKIHAAKKLKQVLGSSYHLDNNKYLLDDH